MIYIENKTFKTIQEAIDYISINNLINTKIYIENGIYNEKIFIDVPFIKLIGEDREKTIVIYNDYANKSFLNGKKYGTFNSYTAFFGGDNCEFENLTFINNAGRGKEIGQAVAVYSDGNNLHFKNCAFISHQDTLFTAPLPSKPLIPDGFFGPRENSERKDTLQYYENCIIKGDIDFIFGGATAIFDNCEIHSIYTKDVISYITAASTPEHKEFGYIFINCKLTSNTDHPFTYLGRPWRNYAKVVFLNCYMGPHIIKEGWNDWDKKDARKTVFFAEYNSYGPGAHLNERVNWAKILTEKEAKKCFEFIKKIKSNF